MSPSPLLLAIRIDDLEFALEPGREYALGSHPHCDVRFPSAEVPPIAVRIRLGDGKALLKPTGGSEHALAVGDSMRVHSLRLLVVVDSGNAVILPIPELQLARQEALAAAADGAAANVAPVSPAVTSPALASATAPPAPAVAAARRDGNTTTFTDLLAYELRRTPWFLLSTLLHGLLLLLLLWLLPADRSEQRVRATLGFMGVVGPGETPPPAPTPTVVAEAAPSPEPTFDELPMAASDDDAAPAPSLREAPSERSLLRIGGERVARGRSAGSRGGSGDILDGAGGGSGNGSFRQTVTDLRRSGLDVVFVVDSTRSMASSIATAKADIAAMLDVLHALVPDVRFGIVTYRDRGSAEDYLLRELPLGTDFYAAVNFVQSIVADGGGDVPEAVADGLHAALQQRFRAGARRVLVLAGDAPPHKTQLQPLLDEVGRFAATRQSFVHALVTATRADEETTTTFTRIAERGNGVCAALRDSDRLLAQVLTFAFGREFAGDLAAVQERIAAERRSPPTWALQLARSGGPELRQALATDPVPAAVVHALVRMPRRHVVEDLAAMLGGDQLSTSGRQIVAYVLQRGLELDNVPIDPERPRPIARTEVERLRALAMRLPE